MDMHMGSHSLPLKFMPCMHSHCLRLFYLSKGTHMSLASLLDFACMLLGCQWKLWQILLSPSHFDQAINAISVLGLLLYVGRICGLGYAISNLNY
jgi:hypothetical protein